jgi:Lrp/AsnC family transcriptional regulator, regulator for asnA, asnC and gidA
MSSNVELDAIDVKILKMLIKDARTRLKDIAEECEISSVSALNRIKRLKENKVIIGSTIIPKLGNMNLPIVATIGVNVDGNKEQEILKAFKEQKGLVEPNQTIGTYDLTAIVFSRDVNQLDKIAYSTKEKFAARKVTLNVWTKFKTTYENLDLQPQGRNH